MTDMTINENSSIFKIILKRIKDFILVPPSPSESIFQFILRQFLIPDSEGKPSITMTISAIAMGLMVYIVHTASKIALTTIKIYDPTTGHLIKESLQGFSAEFYYLAIVIFGAVSYLYKVRQQNKSNEVDLSNDADANAIIAKAAEIINKIKSK
jgi:uncharacterized membrane protein